MTQPVKQYGDTVEIIREIATALNEVIRGRINAVGSFTVGSADTSTVVSDALAHDGSVPLLMPANAAAAAMTPYVSARALGSFTLTHAAPGATADFLYVLLG